MILVKEYYVISHDSVRKVPEWVGYRLTQEDLQGDADRTDDFRPDPELPPGQRAELADYAGSGLDRGHMAPAADFKRNRTAMSQTFFLSNMAPQRPNVNRRTWAALEDEIRELARSHGRIWVFTGPLYLDAEGRPSEPPAFIGPNRVAVPTHFFKAILCEHTDGTKGLFAFIMENRIDPLPGSSLDYAVTVDSVEVVSGLDLFSELPDDEEERMEGRRVEVWPVE